uniref:uncharacterized protein LOC122606633 n=1 Tax=Erigeron canadensis TaxID=72917 RepID=UPI001CB8E530|nr:uncharacterized protein LOC122606633 [Erigeron canadensis]
MEFIKDTGHLNIPFQDIELATNNFTTLIGRGGYGKVYKGKLSLSGKLTNVAVKRLDTNLSGQGFKEFLTEIQLLSRYKHPNLVSLVGFCHEGGEKILVYEYAERGSLDKYHHVDGKTCTLTWKQRINICIDAARGLNYLHNHVAEKERVIHRDLKSANILLDHDWKAMIADLGLSKLGRANENETYLITNACGTQGYCDPTYIHTGVLTKESDVYSFGVVLFEVICGRLGFKNVDNEQRFLASLAQRYYEEGNLNKIIDPCLKNQIEYSVSLNAVSKIAYQCLDSDREKRPSMEFVVEKLVEALELQVFDKFDFLFNTSYPRNDELNRISDSPIVKSSRMQLYTHLSKGILVNGANVWLSVDDEGKNHELISATKFMPLDGKNCTQTFAPQSRFPTVAKILNPSKINMQVMIVTQFLSSDITYAAYLVCKPTYHFPRGFHVTGSLNYELKPGRSLRSSYFSELDQSGWMMAELFQIVNPKRNDGFIVNFKRIDLMYQVQTGIIVEGVKFLPIHKVDDKEIGESDVENLQEREWENHLPSDYKQFIYYSSKDMMAMPQKDVIFPTEQEAYSILSKGIRIKLEIEDEKNVDMWFWITKLNGKKCFMLSPDSFSAPRSLAFRSAPATPDESRYGKVFCKENTRYIYMKFRLIYPLLSTKTTYACYLVYKMLDNKCFEHPSNVTIDCHPMNMEVTHLGIPVSERTPFCSFWSEKTRTMYLKRPRSPLFEPDGLIKSSNPLNKLSNMEFPRERKDGWWEVSLGEFISDYTPCDETTGITSVRPDYDSHISIMIRHLVMIEKLTVQGIEFRPL